MSDWYTADGGKEEWVSGLLSWVRLAGFDCPILQDRRTV